MSFEEFFHVPYLCSFHTLSGFFVFSMYYSHFFLAEFPTFIHFFSSFDIFYFRKKKIFKIVLYVRKTQIY